MKKKYLVELVILALLIIAEAVTLCVIYPDALNAANTDIYFTAAVTIFINIDVLYGIFLLIFNSSWRK